MATAHPPEYTPVRTPRGKLVHAMTLSGLAPACGEKRPRGGFRIVCKPLTCMACKRKLGLVVRKGAKARAAARPAVTS